MLVVDDSPLIQFSSWIGPNGAKRNCRDLEAEESHNELLQGDD